jgi:hypothetical protein
MWKDFFKAFAEVDWFGTLLGLGLGLFCAISLVRCALT